MKINSIAWPLALAAALLGTGCAQLKAGAYNPSYESIDQLRKTQPVKVAVAEVQPSDVKAPVNQISLRASSMISAKGTFAAYLQDAMIADFKEISIYDPQADTRLNATILKNDIDVSGINTGTGTIEVELIVVRGQSQRLKKRYQADIKFESSFAAAIAIPKAAVEYPTLVRALLAKVYTDPEFVKALQP